MIKRDARPFRTAFSAASARAQGSGSIPTALGIPNCRAAIARIPDPVPISKRAVSLSLNCAVEGDMAASIARSARRVVGWRPDPKDAPVLIRTAAGDFPGSSSTPRRQDNDPFGDVQRPLNGYFQITGAVFIGIGQLTGCQQTSDDGANLTGAEEIAVRKDVAKFNGADLVKGSGDVFDGNLLDFLHKIDREGRNSRRLSRAAWSSRRSVPFFNRIYLVV